MRDTTEKISDVHVAYQILNREWNMYSSLPKRRLFLGQSSDLQGDKL